MERETEKAMESARGKDGVQQRNRGIEKTAEKRNKLGNVRINAASRGVRATVVAVEK